MTCCSHIGQQTLTVIAHKSLTLFQARTAILETVTLVLNRFVVGPFDVVSCGLLVGVFAESTITAKTDP
jgi:hypothetical protein